MQSRLDPVSPLSPYTLDTVTGVFVPAGTPDDLGYSEGDATEEALLALVRHASDRSLHSPELAAHAVDWPTRYHLSAGRANLLRPLEHRLRGRTLEVGSGCGVLTRYLAELGGQVVALEGSRRRASITAARCAALDNVTVFHERLERFAADRPFSAVTLVGVLEWAPRFVHGADGAQRVLERAARLLEDDGVLVVAIENQLGLKYFAGWPEDHLGAAMHGINDLYRTGEPRTFGLRDLTTLVAGAGLPHQAVYAPLPDYKFPRVVVSPMGLDDREWSADLAAIAAATPVTDPQDPVLPLFSLEQALALAARNGLLRDLSSSFLLVASRSRAAIQGEQEVLAWHYSGHRRTRFLRETRFLRRGRSLTAEHRPLVPMAADETATAAEAIRCRDRVDEFLPGEVWTSRLGPILNQPGWTVADVAAWARPWRDALAEAAGLRRPALSADVPPHLVDATPFNLVHDDGRFRFFDLEWEPSWRVEFGQALFRGLFWSLSRFRSVAPPGEGVPLTIAALASRIAEALDTPISPSDEIRYLELEADLQHETTGTPAGSAGEALRRLELMARPSLEALGRLESRVEALTEVNAQLTANGDALSGVVARQQEELQQAAAQRAAERHQESERHAAELQRAAERSAAELANARRAGERSEARRTVLERQLSESAVALEQLESARRSVEARLASTSTDLRTATARMAAVAAERDAAKERLGRMEGEAVRRRAELDRAAHDARERERRIRGQQRMLERTRDATEAAERRLRARLAALVADDAAARGPARSSLAGRLRQGLADADLSVRLLTRHPLRFARGIVRLRHAEYRARLSQLSASGLFDSGYYRAVTGAGPETNLVARFLLGGDAAGESPHRLFDPSWYRAHSPDLPPSVPPLLHYLRSGAAEGRDPHPLFDTGYYLEQWGTARVPAPTPLSHFLRVGFLGAASPHPLFDVRHYAEQRPDLAGQRVNPLLHYLAHAATELTDPHPLFSTRFYLAANPDIGAMNPLEHFVRHGAREGRSPHALFDIPFYWKQRPDIRASGVDPLVHFVEVGGREGLNPHPLFDTKFYLEQVDGLRETGVNPLIHFLRWGWRDGLRPNPWFDPTWYLERNPDLDDAHPLVHFVQHGWREGRDPSPEFSLSTYLAHNPDVGESGENPLVHFVAYGRPEGRRGAGSGISRTTRQTSIRFEVAGRAHTPRTIMCVGHVSPWPVGAGNQYALSRLLHHLQRQGYRIVLVLAPISSEPLAPGALDELAAQFGNVVVCAASGKVEFRLRDVPDVLTPLSFDGSDTVWSEPGPDLDYCHDALVTVVKRLADAVGTTAILAQYIFMTRLFPLMGPNTLRIVHTHDVFSQKASNVVAYGITDAHVSESDEARLLNRADVVMAVTPEDARALRRLAPSKEVVLNQVDAAVSPDSAWPTRPAAFLPASGNRLNVTGLRDFLKFAWPGVRAAVPEAELRIAGAVGSAVPPGTPGIVALGRVADLAPEYAAARVVINPAVAGTGLKIKSVEALAHLRPVVGWPHNRDGLSPALSSFVDEATTWREFADAVVARLRQHQSPFGDEERRVVAAALSPEVAYGELDRCLERFFAGPPRQQGGGA